MTEASSSPSPRRRLSWRIVAGVTALAAVACSIALILAEGAVRLAAPQQLIQIRPDLWQAADTLGWTVRPNVATTINTGERTVSVFTDADGFRVGRAGRRDAGAQVLLLGDSFMQALQVEHEQSVATLLAADLERALGYPITVRNAGVDGWNPNQYLIRTRQLVARDTFALIVVAVFVGNDAVAEQVDYMPPRSPVEQHELRMPNGLSWAEIVNAWLAPINDVLERRSHLFTLMKNQMATVRMKLGLTAEYFPYEYRREQVASARWATTARVAAAQASLAARYGIPTLFVLVPERFQVYDELFAEYVSGFGIDVATVDLEQPSRELRRSFDGEGLSVVDALPSFRAARDSVPPLFGSVDRHLSPEGHVLLTSVIAPHAARLILQRPRSRGSPPVRHVAR